ncbi:MAG: ATP-binding protein [Asticcacaulis sp.]|nr:ATP-binding protein [Asticcacaulis sp.]
MQEPRHITMTAPADPAEEFKDFAYIVSHDLAGPVRSMVAFSQLLKESLPVVEKAEDQLHLDLIIESGQKLGEMIQGLLAFSRLNTVPRNRTLVELEIVVARCYMQLQSQLDATKGHFNYPRMPEVMADAQQMHTVFFALLDNAIKFRKPDQAPDIRIRCDKTADFWEFSISDNGIGIDPLFYDDVFRPLRKLHTDEVYPGVGMGLTLARKIIMAHGGEIWLEPSDMGGLKVNFTLPR